MPKPKLSIWKHFEEIKKSGNTGKWAQCKKCRKEMQGIPRRLNGHLVKCPGTQASQKEVTLIEHDANETENIIASVPSTSRQVDTEDDVVEPEHSAKRTKLGLLSIRRDSDVVATSERYTKQIDIQVAKFFYSTSTPFSHVEHVEFRKLCSLLRPGYVPPSRRQIGGPILNEVYSETMSECKNKYEGEIVSMSLDGWSNVHNEPIICTYFVTQTGESVLIDTVDTTGRSHTSEYLKEIALDSISNATKKFGVSVRSIVTDNASNVAKMRSYLESDNLVQYGCSAHILNLLALDLDNSAVTGHILRVIKYFRNKHLAAAFAKETLGKKLILPHEVRWNTMTDAIKSFLENRGKLVQLCQDHRDDIDPDITKIINDVNIVMNAEHMLSYLKPIAVALDRAQRDKTTIAIAVEIWYKLEVDLKGLPLDVKKHFYRRRDMALDAPHYLANMLDHRFSGKRLNNHQRELAFTYLNKINPDFVPFVMALLAESPPFPKYVFGSKFKNTLPMVWWKGIIIDDANWPNKQRFLSLCEQLLTAVAATASLERTFSTFGFVQSKLRNRLGNDKAGKLTFLFKYRNQTEKNKNDAVDWIWENSNTSGSGPLVDELPNPSIDSDEFDDVPLIRLMM